MRSGFAIAISSLRNHKVRAALAMLGVFLGALSLTAVLHVSQAMKVKAQQEIAKLGPNLFAVIGGSVKFRRRSGTLRFKGQLITFSQSDAKAVAEGIPQVTDNAPFCHAIRPIRHGNTTTTSEVVATTPSYTSVRTFYPILGRFITDEDIKKRTKICVLGQSIAETLFGDPKAGLGKTVFFYKAAFTVVGIMEKKGQDLSGANQDEQVFVPLSTYMRRMSNQTWITGVYMNLQDGSQEVVAKKSATAIMRKRHNILSDKEDDFFVVTAQDASRLKTKALNLVWTLGVMSASISFMVGSLGILSIMILLVQARKLEIGVRRAVGAPRKAIITQFLLESALMSGTGGTLGVLSALGIVSIVYAVGDLPFVYDPLLSVIACIASALLGVIAGAYPAWQASRLEVLTVLHE